jgi:serine/threonine protein kinase
MRKTNLYYPTKKDPIYGWILADEAIIGKGFSSEVFKVCRRNNCDYVIKIIKKSKIPLHINREICMQNICADHNLSKHVEDWWILEGGGGVIITQFLKETLSFKFAKIKKMKGEKEKRKLRWNLIKRFIKLVSNLHNIGIIHGDARLDNIMFDYNDKIFFIDMGISFFMVEEEYYCKKTLLNNVVKDYGKLFHMQLYNPAKFMIDGLEEYMEREITKYIETGDDLLKAEKKVVNNILKLNYYNFRLLVNK